MATPFEKCCPSCGHEFTLPDLKKMAVGDGWQRFFLVRHSDGDEGVVSFDDYDPISMEPIARRVTTAMSTLPAANTPSIGAIPARSSQRG